MVFRIYGTSTVPNSNLNQTKLSEYQTSKVFGRSLCIHILKLFSWSSPVTRESAYNERSKSGRPVFGIFEKRPVFRHYLITGHICPDFRRPVYSPYTCPDFECPNLNQPNVRNPDVRTIDTQTFEIRTLDNRTSGSRHFTVYGIYCT